MTIAPVSPHATVSALETRVSFRQPVSADGFIDGGWWPRSRDLTVELPPLLDLLWSAGRDITRATYHLGSWDPAPRRFWTKGRKISLGGFTTQDPLLVSLVDGWGYERIDLLVIAVDAAPELAQRELDRASESGSTDRAGRMLELASQPAA